MLVVLEASPQSSAQKDEGSKNPQRRRDGCSECRRKKVKCDLRRPVCSRCTRYPKECRYGFNFISERQHPKRQESVKRHHRSPHHRSPTRPAISSSVNEPLALPHQLHLNPSPLLSCRESLFFLRLFATETAPLLFPAAPKLFVHQLVNRALDSPHLIHALLAAASSHHGRLVGDRSTRARTTTLKFTNLALSSLRTALCRTEDMSKGETVMTALALCTNDICNGNRDIWRAHLSGATRLLAAFLDHPSNMSSVADPFDLCLVKWFATLDIMASLAGIGKSPADEDRCWYLNKLPDTHPGFVDDISGYSPELMPMLARIGEMASRQDLRAAIEQGTQFILPRQLLEEAQELEASIISISDRAVSEATLKNHGSALAADLRHTHCAFVHATLLHLHRRVLLLQRDHGQVTEDIAHITNAISRINPLSPANILILWPMFSAGCETNLISERNLIQNRMGNMQNLGMGNYTRAKELMRAFWMSGSALPWDVYFAKLEIELVLF